MKLPVAYYNDPILRKKTARIEHIDDELRSFVADMLETMHAHRAIGLAAPQVHQSRSVFVSCVPYQKLGRWQQGTDRIFINPKLIGCSEETHIDSEGCVSIPHILVPVKRPITIQIQATDLDGNIFEDSLTGLFAANFLHEKDHLDGILITDYLSQDARGGILSLFNEPIPAPTNLS